MPQVMPHKKEPKSCHLAPEFEKIKSKISKVTFESGYVPFVTISELWELLEVIGIQKGVEYVDFICERGLYFNTGAQMCYPEEKNSKIVRRYSIAVLEAINSTPSPFGEAVLSLWYIFVDLRL